VTDKLSVSLVTPTYNECENVSLLAEEIFGLLASCDDIDLELIIVDDNSPDGTGAAAEALTDRYPVRVVHRAGKLGLGSAVMEGWKLSDRPYLGVIDADLSHDPEILPGLIRGLRQHDLTMGSRFGETSQVEKWALHRKLISVVGVGLAPIRPTQEGRRLLSSWLALPAGIRVPSASPSRTPSSYPLTA